MLTNLQSQPDPQDARDARVVDTAEPETPHAGERKSPVDEAEDQPEPDARSNDALSVHERSDAPSNELG